MDRDYMRDASLRTRLRKWWYLHKPEHMHLHHGLERRRLRDTDVCRSMPTRRLLCGAEHLQLFERMEWADMPGAGLSRLPERWYVYRFIDMYLPDWVGRTDLRGAHLRLSVSARWALYCAEYL